MSITRDKDGRHCVEYTDGGKTRRKRFSILLEAKQFFNQWIYDNQIKVDAQPIVNEEFREAMLQVTEEMETLVFPNTPVEVNIVEKRGLPVFEVTAEGEWRGDEETVKDLRSRIRETVNSDMEFWETEGSRLNPDWVKWPYINLGTLAEVVRLTLSN